MKDTSISVSQCASVVYQLSSWATNEALAQTRLNHQACVVKQDWSKASGMMTRGMLYRKEGYDLMAAAFEVHRHNGGGLAEEVYQESLEIELELSGIAFRSKQEIAIFYKERELKRRYVPDLYVHDGIVVELKAVTTLLREHEAQLLNYMRLAKKPVGYLINFGPLRGVEYKRFVIG